jgi:hypothetical protein
MMVAPPRTDYDYSPLDLAPPGQRRRRQLVAAALGGLLMLVLVAALVFAFLVLRDSGNDNGETDLAALATQAMQTAEARQASTPEATQPPAETQAADTAQPTATAALDAAGQQAAVDPTQAPAEQAAGAGPTTDQLMAMLPTLETLPVGGLDNVEDTALTQQEVVDALGGSRDAETKLTTWGWSGNATRSFAAPDATALAPDATTSITVSLHGFANDQAAAEALTFYSDVLLNSGYQEVEVGEIGATNRLLVQPQQDGGTLVALYVQQGNVLYRIGGYSPGGDPTENVVSVAQSVIAQAASGQ